MAELHLHILLDYPGDRVNAQWSRSFQLLGKLAIFVLALKNPASEKPLRWVQKFIPGRKMKAHMPRLSWQLKRQEFPLIKLALRNVCDSLSIMGLKKRPPIWSLLVVIR